MRNTICLFETICYVNELQEVVFYNQHNTSFIYIYKTPEK